jgi:hypothetical protein
MINNLIPGAALFSGSESFLKDLSEEDELMITGGRGTGSRSRSRSKKSRSKT